MATFDIHHGDALDVLRGMADNSVDAIVTDPPYFKVKNLDWDRQWDKPQAFLAWIGELCAEWQRVLKPNGSLYCFASPKMARGVGNEIAKRFNILTDIRWRKPPFSTKAEMFDKDSLRSFFPASETIWFAEHYGANSATPIGEAVRRMRQAAGLKGTDIDIALGYVRKKDARRGTELCRRWEEGSSIPSERDFIRAMQACGATGSREHEDLRREYEDLRRPFSVTADVPYTDVWDFATVQAYKGKHACEKPLPLMLHIIRSSTREGATVLDCFSGSAATGEACLRLGRNFIGVEKDEHWVNKGRERLAKVAEIAPVVDFQAAKQRHDRREQQPQQKEFRQVSLLEICAENAA